MTVKTNRMQDAGLVELVESSLGIADRAMQQLSRIAAGEAQRLSAHCNTRIERFIPRRGENRILGGPLSLAQRHAAGRISVRGSK